MGILKDFLATLGMDFSSIDRKGVDVTDVISVGKVTTDPKMDFDRKWKTSKYLTLVKTENKDYYKVRPKSKKELMEIIEETIKEQGTDCDLNFIDVSQMVDLSGVFYGKSRTSFNGDISKWDVTNCRDMSRMFYRSNFRGDISNWNVTNVKSMEGMFQMASVRSDLSRWDVSSVVNMDSMFRDAYIHTDSIKNWRTSSLADMSHVFEDCRFMTSIDKLNWDFSKVKRIDDAFRYSILTVKLLDWLKDNLWKRMKGFQWQRMARYNSYDITNRGAYDTMFSTAFDVTVGTNFGKGLAVDTNDDIAHARTHSKHGI